jgi:hypothetical protein
MLVPPVDRDVEKSLRSVPFLWLGPDALFRRWKVPEHSSYLNKRIIEYNLALAQFTMKNARLRKIVYSNHTAPCAHYHALESSQYPLHIQ